MNRFLAGIVVGASIWAFATFSLFHIFRAIRVIEDELTWGITQGITTLILVVLAWFAYRGRQD